MTRISYIITTACGDALVASQLGGGGYTSTPMRKRFEFLRDTILPIGIAEKPDEIIVAGRYDNSLRELFPSVGFVFVPPRRRDRGDALIQREIATRYSTGDILVYSCDDHRVGVAGDGFFNILRDIAAEDWDILTPRRIHADTGIEMNNGRADGYSPFHTNVFRRRVWAQVPFTSVDMIASDIPLSMVWKRCGFKMVWDDRLYCVDIEAAESEL